MDDLPNRWTFLFAGFGFSAFLAIFVTGLLLLPRRTRHRVSIALIIGAAFHVLLTGTVAVALIFHLSLSFIPLISQPVNWGSCAFIAVMLAFACYGWHYRLTHDAAIAAQPGSDKGAA
jgi:hypothetical protein